MGAPRVGGDIDAWCTRCKQMILHTIVAMVGSTPKRVECRSCGSQHVYKPGPPGEMKHTRAAADGTRIDRRAALRPSDYDRLLEGRDVKNPKSYSPKAVFAEGDVISHPKFGIGVAVAKKDATKIEVMFSDGARVLVHNR